LLDEASLLCLERADHIFKRYDLALFRVPLPIRTGKLGLVLRLSGGSFFRGPVFFMAPSNLPLRWNSTIT
jgi:hypothetical protein